MSREEQQSTPEIPIDLIAENLIRKRMHSFSGVVDTARTFVKQCFIISTPGFAELEPDLGEMESYRHFLRGDVEEMTDY